MAEKYGIKTRVLEGAAETPVSSTSCVVFFGYASDCTNLLNSPQHIYSYQEYLTKYHSGTAPAELLVLDKAAEFALPLINGAWFVNVNADGIDDDSEIDYADLASYISAALEPALAEICLNSSDVPNIICVPTVSESTLMTALAGVCNGKVNGLYHAQAFVDCAVDAAQIDASGDPVAAEIEAPIADGSIVACWGEGILERNSSGVVTKKIPASIIMAVTRAVQDAKNVNNVPYRSVGNIRVNIKGMCIDTPSDSALECTCRQEKMNEVVENGIVSFINKGNNRWYTWGDHTSAVTAGDVDDETYRFDSTVAVLYHILNRFIQKWGTVIDSPMSLRLRDCILSEQQDYLNGLKALGCVVGNPKCEFRALDNSADTLGRGQFYFVDIATIVPPAKFVELGIQYTDEGLSAYIEE